MFQLYKKIKLLLVFNAFLVFCGGAVIASEAGNLEPIPLNEILKDIIKTNPDIIAAKNNYRSVLEELSIAKSGYYPKIGAEASIGPEVTDGVDTNYQNEDYIASRALIYLRQNLFKGGETKAFVEETDARILSAAYEVVTVANRVFLDALEAYINVLKTRELLAFSQQNVLTQERILSQVKERTTAGFTRVSDLTNSKARLSLARGNLISAQQDVNHAVVKFHRQFGRVLQPEQFVMPEPAFKFPDTVEDTTDFAFRNHPALEVAKFNIHARKSAYERTKGAYWPSLDLELKAQYENDTDGDNGYSTQASALLKLSYLFYDGGVRKGEKGQKYHSLLEEYQVAYTERRNVNQAVQLAWNINQAEQVKKGFLNDHLSLSAETLAAFKDEYHLGRRTLLDLLNMENEYNDAKVANAESEYNRLTAYYRISQATGVLIHEFDTGLLEEVNLPTEKPYDLAEYEKEILNPNRDVDRVVDVNDQCDNSVEGSDVSVYGCRGENVSSVGYTEPVNISPYILPEDGTPDALNLKIDTRKDVQSISLDNIHFHFDSSELTDQATQMLIPISKQLKEASDYDIEIIGHTDSVASDAYNQKLSEDRAYSVLQELKRLGLDENRMTSSGRGESEPVADNATDEGRRKNRRTEFRLTK
ncbi:TolC family outer membrane protein [uncultured Desulfobacter sp.]|uniref:TolC family outer membrane protein n=1 Tax=uncultured Desulfobacter sp. TaxID=240139 RepID=UPI0029F58B3B|nr:TolC family outer membrane protein [uncultured Desulfobacter sp.]